MALSAACTTSSQRKAREKSTATRSSYSTRPTCRSHTRRRWSISQRCGTAARARLATIWGTGAAWRSRGIYVYDRGGDNIEFYRFLLSMGLDFIVRLKERYVKSWKRKVMCGELASECRMLYREVVEFDHHGEEKRVTIEFGVVPVRLPDIPDKLLHMVVVRGFGKQPMMLLTTLAKNTSRAALWQVVEGYITRWRVEDTIRHVKQSYKLEDIRLFKYGKLKAMAAVVLATAYFSMAWIGNSEKHDVIARSIARMSFRIHDVPEFHFYAIADGASDVLKRGRRWRGFDPAAAEARDAASLFEFFGLNTG